VVFWWLVFLHLLRGTPWQLSVVDLQLPEAVRTEKNDDEDQRRHQHEDDRALTVTA
jgi:hypothetical protein